MLADVVKQYEEEKKAEAEKIKAKYNHPYKLDTAIYYGNLHIIGGIETWINNLASLYDFSLIYDKADEDQIKRLESKGIECIKFVGQDIECDTLLTTLLGKHTDQIKAKKKIMFVHGVYNDIKEIQFLPECDEYYGVSDIASEHFEKVTGIKTKTLYNPVILEQYDRPLIFGVFSRLSAEKGRWRIRYLLDKLNEANKPFLMLIFADGEFDYPYSNQVVFMGHTLDPVGWMKKCDYICQLSDTEAGCYTMEESLKLSVPVVMTRLPILDEFGVNSTNAKILDMDMSNLDIEDLWNVPVVKDYKEPESRKEWDKIMKKKVFRERYTEEEPKKEVKELKPKWEFKDKKKKGDD